MNYTINKLSKLAGVTIRTLHYYDKIGILKPSFIKENKYRYYTDKEYVKLEHILFFKELEFDLNEIKKILDNPNFNTKKALTDRKNLIELKLEKLNNLINTIDNILNNNGDKNMKKSIKETIDKKQIDEYKKEAKDRWGNTNEYKQSIERTKKWSKEEMEKIKQEGEDIAQELSILINKNIKSHEVQDIVEKHFNHISRFYDLSTEMYRNLGIMYVEDIRFTKYYDKYKEGLAKFLKEAIDYYCDIKDKKNN